MQRDLFRCTHLIIYRTCKRKTNYLKLHFSADCSDEHRAVNSWAPGAAKALQRQLMHPCSTQLLHQHPCSSITIPAPQPRTCPIPSYKLCMEHPPKAPGAVARQNPIPKAPKVRGFPHSWVNQAENSTLPHTINKC